MWDIWTSAQGVINKYADRDETFITEKLMERLQLDFDDAFDLYEQFSKAA